MFGLLYSELRPCSDMGYSELSQVEVAYDVDGTLITYEDQPNTDVIESLKFHFQVGCYVIVWSGGGKEYAEVWVRRLGLEKFVSEVRMKPLATEETVVDLCYDDQIVGYGKVNVRVKYHQ